MTDTYEQKAAVLAAMASGAPYAYFQVIPGNTREEDSVQIVSDINRDDLVNVLIAVLAGLGAQVQP
jgi:hypothetical protein